MKTSRALLFLLTLLIISSCSQPPAKILVFSKTEGFRHESIEAGIAMFQKAAEEYNFIIDTTENSANFNTNHLQNYSAVVFLNTTGDVLDPGQQLEFKRYIQAGGGYVGIHAAADTEYDWPWYGELMGAYFNGHPNNPNVRDASINKTENAHDCTSHLPDKWDRTDEWYNYKSINPNLTVLLNLDESTYEGGTNGDNHPIAWYHEFDGGRAFYTGGGHTDESFSEEAFVMHLLKGVLWATGDQKALNYAAPNVIPEENRFVKEDLDNYFNEPMELDLMPDGSIVFIERKGAIKYYDVDLEKTRTLTTVEVYSGEEDGLIGMALDPNYEKNKHIFLCYSHPKEEHQSISRFTFDPEEVPENVLQDEKVIFTVETQREECCHSGGSLEFDHNGYLWASFGDNTNPHESNGHSPSDERAGRFPFDAQKSSANTNDLRGKILRIKVNEDGSYSIPDGNLFAKDGSEGRPEIYVMGCRNPFRFSVDSETDYVYWGEVGPDASKDSLLFGPRGYDELNQAKEPGFFGWPYFIGNNKAYRDHNFVKGTSGEKHDPMKPINDSPNNTGARELPPAQKAMIYYPYDKSEEFPLAGTGSRNAMAGPSYHFEKYTNENRFPEYYDDKLFIYDWMRGWMMAVSFDENGDMKSMEPFMPSYKWNNLMDVVLGPDGYFYTLEYGSGWFTANENAILSRVKYIRGNRIPQAKVKVDHTAQAIPMAVNFDATGSSDYDGDDLKYSWDFGDGNTAEGEKVQHTYVDAGVYNAKLIVSDLSGASNEGTVKIFAGNTPPEVDIKLTGNQNFYFPGQSISYEVLASDAEDGTIEGKNIALSVDYLEMGYDMTSIAQGHMALSQIKSAAPGLDAIGKSDCVSCHKIDGKSIGPSYMDISKKFADDDRSRNRKVGYLVTKIQNGGGGVWGETAMAAHPDLSPKVAAEMAEYILSLAEPKEIIEIPAKGNYTLKIPEGKAPGGKFVLMASYQDKGANGIESLKTFSNIVLRDASMSAVDFEEVENASKFTVTPDIMPGVKEEFDIVILNNEAKVGYSNLDFSGVGAVVMTCGAPKQFTAGGSFDLYLDSDNSKPFYSGKIEQTDDPTVPNNIMIPCADISGQHTLIAKFKSNEGAKPVGTLMNWTFMPG